jgi:hypothetical protein
LFSAKNHSKNKSKKPFRAASKKAVIAIIASKAIHF